MVFGRLLGKRQHEAAESETPLSSEEPSMKILRLDELISPLNLSRESYGLFILYEPPPGQPCRFDVVAVHGLGGDWEKTWTHQVAGKMWLRDFLPKRFPNIRVMSFGYDSAHALSRSVADINSAATLLVDRLSGERIESPEKKRPIVFIAHSLGGIIVKKAMILANERSDYWKDISESSLGAAFFAVPHRGADVAYWANFAVDIFNFATLGTLGNTGFLKSLKRNSDEFSNISQAFIQPASKFAMIRTFTESVKTGNLIIVDNDSATLGIQNEMSVEIPGADHRSICRFAAAELQSYRLVENALRQIFSKIETATIGFTEAEMKQRVTDFTENALGCLKFKEIFHRREHITDAHSKTLQWIFVEPEQAKPFLRDKNNFVSWLKKGSGIYWINGKAASGKSTLMKYLCDNSQAKDYLKSWSGDLELVVVGCYFWACGTEYQRSFAGLLRSLLYGVLKQLPSLILVLFDEQLKNYMNFPNPINKQLAENLISVDEKSLLQYFEKLVQQRSIPIHLCFFIDGLDEFEGKAGDLIKFIQFLANAKGEDRQQIKVCVSSRPELEFQNSLANFPTLRMQDLNEEDIALYVRDHLTSHNVINDLIESERSQIDSLIENIITRAKGVFLWVRLVVNDLTTGILHGDRINELWDRLNDLPLELSDLYTKMLDRLKQKNPSYYASGLRYFTLVQACREPPSILTIYLADIDITQYLGTCSATLTIDEIKEQCQKMTVRLSSRCAGLLEVISPNFVTKGPYCLLNEGTVQFIHRTARDYIQKLASNNPTHKGFRAHEILARSHLVQLKHYFTFDRIGNTNVLEWFTSLDNCWWHLQELHSSTNEAHIEITDTILRTAHEVWKEREYDLAECASHYGYILGPPIVMAIANKLHRYVEAKITKTNFAKYDRPMLRLLLIAMFVRIFYSQFDDSRSYSGQWQDNSSLKIVKHLLDCGADPEKKFPTTTGLPGSLNLQHFTRYDLGDEISPWYLCLFGLFRYGNKGFGFCELEMSVCMDTLEVFVHHGVNMSEKIWVKKDTSFDSWEILSEFYEPHFPKRVQDLKSLMLEKGYCPR